MTIHTTQSLGRSQRRLDRRNAGQQRRQQNAARILQVMRDGAVLYRCNRQERTFWVISTGEHISSETVTDVLLNPHVIGVGDSLFGAELSQTFRYSEEISKATDSFAGVESAE